MGTHSIESRPATRGRRGALTITEFASSPIAAQSTITSGITGEQIPVPEGSLKEYLRRHASALGGEDGYVKLLIHYEPSPGEQKRTSLPPGWSRVPPPRRCGGREWHRSRARFSHPVFACSSMYQRTSRMVHDDEGWHDGLCRKAAERLKRHDKRDMLWRVLPAWMPMRGGRERKRRVRSLYRTRSRRIA